MYGCVHKKPAKVTVMQRKNSKYKPTLDILQHNI